MFQAVNILSADGGGVSGECGPQVQECWEFDCPRKDAVLGKRGQILVVRIHLFFMLMLRWTRITSY